MSKTSIDWADHVWNPVWGCRYNCPYCYARYRIAPRFARNTAIQLCKYLKYADGEMDKAVALYTDRLKRFELTELPYKWDMKFPKGSAVFVNSMSDPHWWEKEWLEEIAWYMLKSPMARDCTFITLTKDYTFTDGRFCTSIDFADDGYEFAVNRYLGYTVTTNADIARLKATHPVFTDHQFVNIEPLLEPLTEYSIDFLSTALAVIIGAETGNRKGIADIDSVVEWIQMLVYRLEDRSNLIKPIFVKEPAYSKLCDLTYNSREEAADYWRVLLWKTRKAVV